MNTAVSAREIAIYGAGGMAREVAWLAASCDHAFRVVAFVDDDAATHGSALNETPVMGLDELRTRHPSAAIVSGIGDPGSREIVMSRSRSKGAGTENLIHPGVVRSKWISVGSGVVVCAGSTLTTNITLGDHVQINLHCTVGHDVVMEDYATLAPGVHVSGWVHIGKRAYIGTGAVIVNGTERSPIVIGDDAVVGAAACVTKNVAAGVTVIGVPAKPLLK